MSVFNALIQPNSTVNVEALSTTRDASGGTVEAYTVVESGLRCLISQVGGSRDGRFDGDNNIYSATLTGDSSYIGRTDVRFYVVASSEAGIAATYARAVSVTRKGSPGVDPLLTDNPWFSAKIQQMQP